MLAFNAKRGFPAFGRERVANDDEYVELIRTEFMSLTRRWEKRSARGMLLRYEDIVRSPGDQLHKILDTLQLDSSREIINSMVKAGNETSHDMQRHRTSPDGQASIGRWKRDLRPRLRQTCDNSFRGLLDALGYDSQS
jgi:hypothetical protein